MTTPPIPQLPMAIIVAARDVLLVHRGDVWASSITGVVHSWSCSCGEAGPVDNRKEGDRLAANHIAAVTLAAALGVCEVREGFAADTGDYVTTTPLDRAAAQREVDAANDHSRARGNAPHTRLVRRLWITSPAEQVDTEGATT